jgi:hypothetical protein
MLAWYFYDMCFFFFLVLLLFLLLKEIGNFKGVDPLRTDEEQTNWGLYCVISAPLILGNDLSVNEDMDRIWVSEGMVANALLY